jgi:hypothetical protein
MSDFIYVGQEGNVPGVDGKVWAGRPFNKGEIQFPGIEAEWLASGKLIPAPVAKPQPTPAPSK